MRTLRDNICQQGTASLSGGFWALIYHNTLLCLLRTICFSCNVIVEFSSQTLKTGWRHHAKYDVTVSSGGCHYDNLRWHQWRVYSVEDLIQFPVPPPGAILAIHHYQCLLNANSSIENHNFNIPFYYTDCLWEFGWATSTVYSQTYPSHRHYDTL